MSDLSVAQATEVVRALIAIAPEEEELYAVSARLMMLKGEHQVAKEFAQERFRVNPSADSAMVISNIGQFFSDELEEQYWFAQAERLDRDNALVLARQLRRQITSKNWDEALQIVERSRTLYPDSIGAYERQYRLARAMDDHERANLILNEAPEWFRNRSIFHELRAAYALSQGDLEEAECEARRAVAMTPAKSTALLVLAKVLQKAEKLEEASTFAREAVESAPGNSDAMVVLRTIAHRQGKSEEAREWTRRISETASPASPTITFYAATQALGKGDFPSAYAEFRKIIAEDSRTPIVQKARRFFVSSLVSDGKWAEARHELDEAHRSGQIDPGLDLSEFSILVHEGKADTARAQLEKILANGQPSWEAYGSMISFLLDSGDRPRAKALLGKMIEVLPAPVTMCKSSRTLLLAGHVKEAKELFEAARDHFPEYEPVLTLAKHFQPSKAKDSTSSEPVKAPLWKRLLNKI